MNDNKVFDLINQDEGPDLNKPDWESMTKKEIKEYIKSNYKIKQVRPLIASDDKLAEIFNFNVAAFEEQQNNLQEYLNNPESSRQRKSQNQTKFNERRMADLYAMGFGQEEGDVVHLKDGIDPLRDGQMVITYPDYVGYFDPKTWGENAKNK